MKICFEFDVTPVEARQLFGFGGPIGSMPAVFEKSVLHDPSPAEVENIADDSDRVIPGR